MNSKERFANTLPFCGVKDKHDALVVAAHTFMIDAGYKCIGIGEKVPESTSSISTESLPQGWNTNTEFYCIIYKAPSSYQRIFVMKVLRLESKLAFQVLDVDREISVDLTVHTSEYITGDNNNLLKNLYNYPEVVKRFEQLHEIFKTEVTNKLAIDGKKSIATELSQNESCRSQVEPVILPDNPLHVPSRRPRHDPLIHDPLIHDPRGFGDPDLLPGHPGVGGMFMDPFHQQHRRPQRYPGLPSGAIPPGARFDPFGPDDDRGNRGRFREPGPDHLRPPGFEDDMFM